MSTAASALHERQRHYDRLHHLSRLVWLDKPAPTYACGTPVPRHEALGFRESSKCSLELIERHGMSDNSVDLGDTGYLAELDAFAATLS